MPEIRGLFAEELPIADALLRAQPLMPSRSGDRVQTTVLHDSSVRVEVMDVAILGDVVKQMNELGINIDENCLLTLAANQLMPDGKKMPDRKKKE